MDLNEIEDRIWRSPPIITLEVEVSFAYDPGFAVSVRRQLVQSAIAEGSLSPIVFPGQTREDLVDSFVRRYGVSAEPSPKQPIEDREHIWYVRPSHWRNDYWRFDGSGRVDAGFNIYDGRTECRGEYALDANRQWTPVSMAAGEFHEPETAIHPIMDYMFLDPGTVLLDGYLLASAGETTVLGRRAIRLAGLPKAPLDRQPRPFMNLWLPGAERYEFLLDAEFGILLGYQAFRQNACVGRLRLDHMLINQPIPESMFRLSLSSDE